LRLVEVHAHRHVPEVATAKGEEGREVDHVADDHGLGAEIESGELLGQCHGPAPDAPLPPARRQGHQLNRKAEMVPDPFRPDTMGSAEVGLYDKDRPCGHSSLRPARARPRVSSSA
jgi:hypothetical protein